MLQTTKQPRTVSRRAGTAWPPKQVGQWQLAGLAAEGNWSQVYHAEPVGCTHSTFDYVVKLPRPELIEDEVANDMLWREAAIASSVAHPNLCAVLAAGFDDPPSYLVQPRVRGVNLRETLTYAARLGTPHALWIARQIAAALGALHEHGWLHGDLKPSNVLLDADGHATLIDLGMAQRLPVAPSNNFSSDFSGTPNYAAPEWSNANLPVGRWSDIYSLGQTLFEMLAGQLPTDRADSRVATSQAARQIRGSVPDLPRSVVELLGRMLATEPLRRPTAEELVTQLTRLEIETLDQRIEA